MVKAATRPVRSRPMRRPGWRRRLRRIPWPTIAVIAVGGVLGALARQGLWVVIAALGAAYAGMAFAHAVTA